LTVRELDHTVAAARLRFLLGIEFDSGGGFNEEEAA